MADSNSPATRGPAWHSKPEGYTWRPEIHVPAATARGLHEAFESKKDAEKLLCMHLEIDWVEVDLDLKRSAAAQRMAGFKEAAESMTTEDVRKLLETMEAEDAESAGQ